MVDTTQIKGLSIELHCSLDFTQLGFACLTPIVDSSKYDIVVDLGNKFIKIQCKSSCWDKRAIGKAFTFSTTRQTTNTQKTTRYKYSPDEVDYFYTWFNGQGYLISIKEAAGTVFTLRYEYPSSNQKQGIHIADNYKIEEVIKKIV